MGIWVVREKKVLAHCGLQMHSSRRPLVNGLIDTLLCYFFRDISSLKYSIYSV